MEPHESRITLSVEMDEVVPVVLCANVGRRYRTAAGDVDALDDVSVEIVAGTFTAVAGPSGSGKSTLLSIIGCVDRSTSGKVYLDATDLERLSRRARRETRLTKVSTILPQPSDNLLDHLDAAENVRWTARLRGREAGDVGPVFQLLGIAGCETKRVRQLSGGEQQRLALACALAGDPTVVLADEPTASLDGASSLLVVAAMRAAVQAGATVVVATHDSAVIDAADRVVWLDHGRLVGHSDALAHSHAPATADDGTSDAIDAGDTSPWERR